MPQRLHYPASTQLGGSDQLVLEEGVLSLGTPRARVGDKTEASAASAITSGGRMLRTEMPTPGAAGASTSSIAGGAAYVYAIRYRNYPVDKPAARYRMGGIGGTRCL